MNRAVFLLSVSISLIIIFSFKPSSGTKVNDSEVRNIIFLIGDGMGISAVYAAMTASPEKLNFERCRFAGFQKTFSLTDYITDSAAAGTALSSGKKTKNGTLGMDAMGNKFKSILEVAEEKGLATGMVSTSSVTHATPAAFIAHVAGRDSYEDIAFQFLGTDIDVFIGGGIDHFFHRKDGLNLYDSLKLRGYEVDTTLESILSSKSSKLSGLTASIHNPYRMDGRGDMLPLSVKKSIDILSKNPKGFFLMIEGSQIDWAAHGNDAARLIDETLDFDKALGVALDFAQKDGHTLVVVTADHETGGVCITGGETGKYKAELQFSTTNHTGVMVPIFAFGPGSEKFTGILDNTEFYGKFLELYKF